MLAVASPEDPMSIFLDGKLKPGTYRVQNVTGHTFLEIHWDSGQLCCRPASVLSEKDGLWEFQVCGSGYQIKKLEDGKPAQFCSPSGGFFVGFGSAVRTTAFPAAWNVQVVDNITYRGFGYVSIFLGSTNKVLDLNWGGSSRDGTTVRLWENIISDPCRMWKLTPVRVDEALPEY